MRLNRAAVTIATVIALSMTAACAADGGSSQESETGTSSSTFESSSMSTSSSSPTPSTESSSSDPASSFSDAASSAPATTSTSHATKKPTDPLTGETLSDHPVLAVKIDNTSFPQFGVHDADVIYTEQVEGGLTRLIAMFHTTFPKEVGPVRSIRSTDFQLLPSYGKILLVNSGGDTVNLRKLRDSVLTGVSEGAPGFWRSKDRRAPYNLHANLQKIVGDHPNQPDAQQIGFHFAATDPAHLADARTVSDIDVTMIVGETSFTYVDGRYDAYHGGHRYVDADGTKVDVDNVIVQHVSDKKDGTIDPIGNPAFMTTTVGHGKFTLYRDGKAVDGTWSRTSSGDPTKFLGADGTPVKLKPGKTWVILAPQTATFNKG